MKTELLKPIDNCTEAFITWLQQSDLTDVLAVSMYAVFYITGLYIIGLALTPARSSD